MKALSLKQPWAELVLQGRKTIETRTWNTKFRGEFLIHASKIPDKEAMKRFGFSDLPAGKIVGKAELTDVIEFTKKSWKKDKNTCANWMPYRKYGFVLKKIKRIKPKKAKGKLGFWDY
ncbi:ASCH domain-containing protein [Candidatus Woesearchaeota archaeon]|nr:ASCH domain-containing protein [Candidatus Woesearchaeota archaeon]